MKIGNQEINNRRIYVIAEIGNNHNGDFNRAIEMINEAIEAGADCVKFQMRHLDKVYRKKALKKDGEDLGTEYVVDLLNRFELTPEEHKKLFQYCKKNGITYLCTPWDSESVKFLNSMGVEAFKVASADLTNLPLIKLLIDTKKPLILSTGMSTPEEIQITINFLNKHSAEFILLHCNSTYPAPIEDINLKWINKLKKLHSYIGYSGHERGINVTLASVAFDICLVERHFTQDRKMEGPDHAASLTKDEFKRMVLGIREIELSLGGHQRMLSQGEMINRENLSKSLVSSRPLKKGEILSADDIKVRSPGQGLSPQMFEKLIGIKLTRDIPEEDYFFKSDIDNKIIKPKQYKFSRPWGIPVRHHDFSDFQRKIKPDIYEFHLSYSDIELDIDEYFRNTYESDFVVHAPELFGESKLLDLASADEEYRNDSINNMQKVINLTRDLKRFFPKTEKPLIVTNIGGFSMDEPFSEDKIEYSYELFSESLESLDLNGVELIPQTMAPFPWHFGGQRFQNLFVHADEIEFWCKKLNLRICFDVSHSSLTCNKFKKNLYDFCNQVAPLTAHLHLGDASGFNGEGLQIGDGKINFKKLMSILNEKCPNASFIPEIWQGHKNNGEGFWIALERLEKFS
jgi:sialic acid synthase SpsE/sugar phosphate isomerase/epimerase